MLPSTEWTIVRGEDSFQLNECVTYFAIAYYCKPQPYIIRELWRSITNITFGAQRERLSQRRHTGMHI